MEKQPYYITDITLHMRGFRPTVKFTNVAPEGRIYVPFPKQSLGTKPCIVVGGNKQRLELPLPSDLMEMLEKDGAELWWPAEGLHIFAGRDVYEYLAAEAAKKERVRRYIPGSRTWHAGDKV